MNRAMSPTRKSSSQWRMDDADNVPLYLRVANSLRSRINTGEWKAGIQLPTMTDLAAEYAVAVITVRQAVRLLVDDGLVTSGRGRGTFVAEGVKGVISNRELRQAINDRLNLPDNCDIKIIKKHVTTSLPATILISDGPQRERYVAVEKLHLADGDPFAFMSLYVEENLFSRVPKGGEKKAKILRLLVDSGSLKLSRSSIQIVLTYADERLAKLLHCPPLSALVRIRTLRFDMDGYIIMVTDAYYRGDKFLYEIEEENIDLSRVNALAFPDIKS